MTATHLVLDAVRGAKGVERCRRRRFWLGGAA